MPWFAFVRETTTGASGAFRLEAMPTARTSNTGPMPMIAWLTGSATGFAPTVVEFPTAPGFGPTPSPSGVAVGSSGQGREVELVLRRGAKLSGRVVDADTEKPVALADVRLTSTEMGRGWTGGSDGNAGMRRALSPFEGDLLAVTRASAAGEFTFDHVPCLVGPKPPVVEESKDRRPFAGRLTATAEGYATGVVLIRQVEEDGVDTRELRLWRPGIVRGRLIDRDGKPLPGVPGSVQIAPPTANADGFTTDVDGRFVVRDLPAPAAGVAAKISLYDNSGRTETPFELRGGSTTEVPDIVVELGRRPADLVELHVQVVDAGGAPIWGAYAQFVEPGIGPSASTDRTGNAVVLVNGTRFAATDPIEIAAWAPGYARATVRKGKDAAKREGIVVRLEAGRRITGLVRLADGTPAVGAVVRARRGDASSATSATRPGNPNDAGRAGGRTRGVRIRGLARRLLHDRGDGCERRVAASPPTTRLEACVPALRDWSSSSRRHPRRARTPRGIGRR